MVTILCKCGAERRRNKNGKICGYCVNPECSPRFGIKRPEHAVKMKALAASGENSRFSKSLMQKGKLHNKTVNTDKFKETVLKNKGIEFDNIEDAHSKFLSDNAKGRHIKSRQCVTKYMKWNEEFQMLAVQCCDSPITLEWLESLDEDQFIHAHKILHGIQTSVNMERHKDCGRNKHYIRVEMHDLKYNIRGKDSVLTRSKLESLYIDVFEKECIPWDYEWIRLPNENDVPGTYSPDFYFEYMGQKYILEVKGDWYHSDKDEYYAVKIAAAVKWAKSNNCIVGVSYVEPKNMGFLDKVHFIKS